MTAYRKQRSWLGTIETVTDEGGPMVRITFPAGAGGMLLESADARRFAKWLRKAADAAEWRPRPGDHVEVLYGRRVGAGLRSMWDGPGVVVSEIGPGYVRVAMDHNHGRSVGGFRVSDLRPIRHTP